MNKRTKKLTISFLLSVSLGLMLLCFILTALTISGCAPNYCEHDDYKYYISGENLDTSPNYYTNAYKVKDGILYFDNVVISGKYSVTPNPCYKGK